jgi:amino acid adenylation domain-containing protein
MELKNCDNGLPLSFSQQRLWILDKLLDKKEVYNISTSFHLIGTFEIEVFKLAVHSLVKKHEILRTSFHENENGIPFQKVHFSADPFIEYLDYSHLTFDEMLVTNKIDSESQYIFELSTPNLFRFLVIEFSGNEYALLFVVHHIIFDGWSMGIFFRDLSAFYNDYIANNETNVKAVDIQYADFAVWQRENFQNQILEEQVTYWKFLLKNSPRLSVLPPDFIRPRTFTHAGGSFSIVFEQPKVVKSFCKQSDISLSMFFLSLFYCLIYRYTGQQDLILGVPSANRNQKEIENTIGFFVNMLPLRLTFSDAQNFLDVLKNVKNILIEAHEYQDAPFEKIVDALALERSPNIHPLFQTIFVFQNTWGISDLSLKGIQLEFIPNKNPLAIFDLSLECYEDNNGLIFNFIYSKELYKTSTISQFAKHYVNLLSSVITNPNKTIDTNNFINAEEKESILVTWNQTLREYPRNKTFLALFEKQALTTPHAIALSCNSSVIDYITLKKRARDVAAALICAGLKKGDIVGLHGERDIDFVVAVLGIMLSGGVYLPLDEKHPKKRLIQIISDSKLKWLWASRKCLDLNLPGITVLTDEVEDNFTLPNLNPDDLAYVIYTSGSTGTPKGALLEHRGMLNHLFAKVNDLGLTATDCIAQTASSSFDISIWQMFAPLLVGGSVRIYSDKVAKDPDLLLLDVDAKGITVIELVPTMLHMSLELTNFPLTKVRWMISTGEALSMELAKRWLEHYPNIPLINAYGPTECSDDVTHHIIKNLEELNGSIVPIGRPIQNTQLYILDRYNQPVPQGVIGELCVAGNGVGRGYLNDPEKTNHSFIKNPFGEGKLYRTGDLARYLTDGCIVFLGRKDEQVKVRGHRIEIAEIEQVLNTSPLVDQGVVSVMPNENKTDKKIIAYIKNSRNHFESSSKINFKEGIERYLKNRLPAYMLPYKLIFVKKFPLNANGKIDKNKLPIPIEDVTINPPEETTENHKTILKIWIEVLGRKDISVHDNFFSIGGNSLLATQIVSRMRTTFNVQIALRDIFEFPTVDALEQRLCKYEKNHTKYFIKTQELPKTVPLSFAQQRLWFLDQLFPNRGVYNISFALKFSGELDTEAFKFALKHIHRRHDSLRTNIVQNEYDPTQVSSNIDSPLPYEKILADGDFCLESFVAAEAAYSFDLQREPLYRVRLIILNKDEYLFCWTMHHIISDGWSMGILFKEISILYQNFNNQNFRGLPQLSISYLDYTLWQRRTEHSTDIEKELQYWAKNLDGIPETLNLPNDYRRPRYPSYEGKIVRMRVELAVLQKLHKLTEASEASLFIIILACLKILLYRYTGQMDVVVGTPVANRNQIELEEIVGFFVNTLALRTKLDRKSTFLETLTKIKDNALSAYEHQNVPFEQLVDHLNIVRDLSRHPVFQVMLFFQGIKDNVRLELPGLTIEEIDSVRIISKLDDLSIWIFEAPDFLNIEIEYATDLFKKETMEKFGEHFIKLLEEIVTCPNKMICKYDFITEQEKKNVLTWNSTSKDYPLDKTFIDSFLTQVKDKPGSVAINGLSKLNYTSLEFKSRNIASTLVVAGVAKGDIVGLYVPRNIELVVLILGIMRAGAVYLPLDPSQPSERIHAIVKESHLKWILATKELKKKISCDVTIITEYVFSEPCTLPVVSGKDLAYIIYTSGSTGIPKGVMVEHRGMLNHLLAKIDALKITSKDRVAQNAAMTFDISIWQMFAPLLVGGSTEIITDKNAHDPYLLLQDVEDKKITILEIVPSMLQMLLELAPEYKISSLGWLISTGEELDVKLAKNWISIYPQIPLLNAYGPTECSDDVTHYFITSVDCLDTDAVPIGKPIHNIQIYILDRDQSIVPTGTVGEICVTGAGVGPGYLFDTVKTTQSFIKNPFGFGRMYKTGDLGRYLADGRIMFLGRVDTQVKVRGYRIELREIELVLESYPDVERSIVLAREVDNSHDKNLVAYIKGKCAVEDIKQYLKGKLPDYMVPNYILMVKEFKKTKNGKIDRNELSRRILCSKTKNLLVIPKSKIERGLLDIFKEVLRQQDIGITDNFFDIGGHSLLAMQVISRIKNRFSIQLPLSEIFDNPSVKLLSKVLKDSVIATTNLVVGKQVKPANIPLSFAQQRIWFLDKLVNDKSVYNIHFGFELSGNYSKEILVKAFNTLHERHDSLRTRVVSGNSGRAMQLVKDKKEKSPIIEIYVKNNKKREDVIKYEMAYQFDLERESLYRICLLNDDSERFLILIVMHHIISDGWSLDLLLNELNILYYNYERGLNGNILPHLELQYVDFTLWQKKYLQGEVLDRQIKYWKSFLHNIPQNINLPTDHTRPDEPSYKGMVLRETIPAKLLKSIRELSLSNNTSLFMSLLSMFYLFLHRYTGENDIVIGTPIANRHYKELEGIVGFFANTLALRMLCDGSKSFLELMEDVKQMSLKCFEHQDLPFEHLVELLNVDRDITKNPVFQTMFIFVNKRTPLNISDLEVSELELSNDTSKFDLTLSIIHTDQDLLMEWEFALDLFYPSTIKNFSKCFLFLLEQVISKPNFKVQSHELSNRYNSLLAHKTGNISTYKPVTEYIEETTAKYPYSLSLLSEKTTLTYSELNEKVNRLAHYLTKLGLGKGKIAAVLLPNSVDFIISIIAILKTGAAYLPIDISHPTKRKLWIINNARPFVCIVTGSESLENHKCINLYQKRNEILLESVTNLSVNIDPHDAAYVVYTSGSTGEPKGVVIEHCNLSHYLKYCLETYFCNQRTLLHSSIAYDMVVTVFFAPLASGGSIEILASDDLSLFIEHMQRDVNYGFIKLTPSKLRLLIGEIGLIKLAKKVSMLILGGEELLADDVAELAKHGICIYNEYGPTETTVGCISHRIDSDRDYSSGRIPIGKPFKYVNTYVVDKNQKLAVTGMKGELLIGGSGVARGYLNDSTLTRKYFTDDFITNNKGKLYRSGDIVKLTKNGDLEYICRKDDQVKVRGYRVNTIEIKKTILQCSLVEECFVQANKRHGLLAYIVLRKGNNTLQNDAESLISKELSSSLPYFMLPERLIFVDTIPLNSNAKIDQEKLNAISDVPTETKESGNTGLDNKDIKSCHKRLKTIFYNILNVRSISLDDDFFKLGGTSILVLELIEEIKRLFFKELRPSDIFKNSSISKLMQLIHYKKLDLKNNSVMPIQENGLNPPLFLVHPGGGLIYRYMDLREHISERKIYGINNPRLSEEKYFDSIEDMANEYIELIDQTGTYDYYLLGGWSLGGMIAFEMACKLLQMGRKVKNVIMIDAYNLSSFNQPLTTADDISEILNEEGIDTNSEAAQIFAKNVSNNEIICQKYMPSVYNCRVVLLKAAACVKGDKDLWIDRYNGWKNVAPRIEVFETPGIHDKLFDPENVGNLANALKKIICE